ncbi:PIN domain-containing protein [Limnofasciculus baicalensis]|uniref:PIN domain-containing protein n=1 Tax=Limnofasciculus baicalensis BBK-W-15 TaxID=2699891 RepID=A0AAE3GNK4_9CYAN|nr:PIN domain-containing protein [Limnofasciculus baicalensis]MCP2727870.1 PIN domain-containing protein [Limnofasciculus baicalensis BBK-W-15]
MNIYLDTSALNRIFDDRSQMRISLEAKAVEAILLLIETSTIDLVASAVLAYEISQNPYRERQDIAVRILQQAKAYQTLAPEIIVRGRQLESTDRIASVDALHIACEEALVTDYFITCDDRLIKRYKGAMSLLNPVEFILKITTKGE